MKTYEFNSTESLQYENSFTVLKAQENIKLKCSIGIREDQTGWFEIYDQDSEGEDWYAEGGLWFQNNKLTEYDGVFALPISIISKLEELGYNCDEVK